METTERAENSGGWLLEEEDGREEEVEAVEEVEEEVEKAEEVGMWAKMGA